MPKVSTSNDDVICARVPLDVKRLLQVEAENAHVSLSDLLSEILSAYVHGDRQISMEDETLRRARSDTYYIALAYLREAFLKIPFPESAVELQKLAVKARRQIHKPVGKRRGPL